MLNLRQRLLLLGIILVAGVAFLEFTIANTALPMIQKAFHAKPIHLQWIMNIYFLVLSTTMIIVGRFGDMFGVRRIFYTGAIIILLASIGAGLSPTLGSLIFFRAIQALGVSIVVVLGPALVFAHFGESAHKAMGIYGMLTGIALAIGPYVSGVILTYLDWPWIFFINVPLVIIGLLFCAPFLPKSPISAHRDFDLGGAIFLIIGLACLVFGIIQGSEFGFTHPMGWLPLLIAIVVLPVFIVYELKQTHPLFNLTFFRKPVFFLAALCCGVSGLLTACVLFFSPLYLNTVKHFSPHSIGLCLLAMPVAIVFFSTFVGRHSAGKRALWILCGSILLAFILSIAFIFIHQATAIGFLIFLFFITGIVWTVCNVVTPISIQSVLNPDQAGLGIGIIFSFFNIFSSVFLAIAAGIFHTLTEGKLASSHYIQNFLQGMHGAFIFIAASLLLFSILSIIIACYRVTR